MIVNGYGPSCQGVSNITKMSWFFYTKSFYCTLSHPSTLYCALNESNLTCIGLSLSKLEITLNVQLSWCLIDVQRWHTTPCYCLYIPFPSDPYNEQTLSVKVSYCPSLRTCMPSFPLSHCSHPMLKSFAM